MSNTPPTGPDVPRIPSMSGPSIPPQAPPLPQTSVEDGYRGPKPIGGVDPNLRLIQSLDGFVDSVTAAAQEITSAVRQLKAIYDRTGTYYGGSTSSAGMMGGMMPIMNQMMGNVMSQTFTSMGFNIAGPQLQQILNQSSPQVEHFRHIQQSTGAAEAQAAMNRASQQAAQAAQRDAARTSSPDRLPPHGTDGYQDPTLPEAHGSLERYRQARAQAPKSIGELRQRAIGYAQQAIQKRMTASGRQQLGKVLGRGGGDMLPVGSDMGGFTAEQAASSLGQGGSLGKLSTMLGAGAEEGGMGALASVLPEAAAGPVGWAAAAGTLAWEGVKRGTAFAEQQRSENARFQSIMGGSNIAGFGQRAQQSMFRYGQMGTMSGEQANQLFMGMTETGLRGRERQGGLDFATREYKNLGMSVEESLHVINVAAQNGKTQFADLATTLDRVTSSAAKAGVNTEKARKNFVDTYETFVGAFGAQGGGSALAAGISQPFTSNRLTQNVQAGGMLSNPSVLMMAAARSGMTPGQLQGLLTSPNPQDQLRAAGALGGQEQFAARSALGPQGVAALQRIVRQVAGAKANSKEPLSSEQYQVIRSEAQRDPALQGSMVSIPGGAQQALQQLAGINAPDDNSAWVSLIDIIRGANNPQQQAKANMNAQHKAALGQHGAFSGGGVFGKSGMLSTGSLLSHVPGGGGIQRGLTDVFSLTTGTTVGDALGHIPVVGGTLGWVEKHTNPFFYARSAASHLPVVGGLFGGPSGKEKAQAAYSALEARHPDVFKGPAGHGKEQELDWLVSQHGGEQINVRDPKTGKSHKMSVADAIKKYGASNFGAIEQGKVGKTGVTVSDFIRSGAGATGDDGKSGGSQKVDAHVTISAKPALQKWLDFNASGANSPQPGVFNMPPPNQRAPGFGQSGQ